MFKKLLFIVSLLYSALFHSSAEVYYLKLNGKKVDGSFQISEGVSSEIFKSATLSNFNSSNNKAIYYDNDGKIVIYLPQVEGHNYSRAEEAKKQFENILNSGLIKNGNFDLRYVDVPAGWKSGNQISSYRQMPGIAVRIDNVIKESGENIETFHVMCATKSGGKVDDKEGGATKFLTKASWGSFFDKEVKEEQRFYDKGHTHQNVANAEFLDDGEHTERQLFYSLIYDNIVSDVYGKIRLQGTKASTVGESAFFVWTKGNPCITDANFHYDNGGGCCSVWYKNTLLPKLRSVSSQVFIYFNNKVPPRDGIWLCAPVGHHILTAQLIGRDIQQRGYCIPAGDIEDKQVLGVRMVDTNVPNDFETLFVNVDMVSDVRDMQDCLNLKGGLIPYVVDYGGNRPLSYSFTTAGREGVIELLNQWMNGGGQPTIQFVDHYKN